MKINGTILKTLAVLTLAVGLAGCAGGTNGVTSDSDFESLQNSPQVPKRTYSVTFEVATGKVVKITASDSSEALYADPALETMDESGLLDVSSGTQHPLLMPGSSDPSASDSGEVIPAATGPFSFSYDTTVESTIHIAGKDYVATAGATATASLATFDEAIAYYNANLAAPSVADTDLLEKVVLSVPIKNSFGATIQSTVRSNISFVTSGASAVNTNDGVANDWANQVPAWQAYRNMVNAANGTSPQVTPQAPPQNNSNVDPGPSNKDNPGGSSVNPDYLYSFVCATYDVALANGALTLDAINEQLGANVQLTALTGRTSSVLVESSVPCEVIKF